MDYPPLLFAGLDAKKARNRGTSKYRVSPVGQHDGCVGEGMMKTHCTFLIGEGSFLSHTLLMHV